MHFIERKIQARFMIFSVFILVPTAVLVYICNVLSNLSSYIHTMSSVLKRLTQTNPPQANPRNKLVHEAELLVELHRPLVVKSGLNRHTQSVWFVLVP